MDRAEVWVRFMVALSTISSLNVEDAAREADLSLAEFDKRFLYHNTKGWQPVDPRVDTASAHPRTRD